MSKDLRDMAPRDMIRRLEAARGGEAMFAKITGSTGYATCSMAHAAFDDADLVVRARSPRHRMYVGLSAGAMAANPELVKAIMNRDGSIWAVDSIHLARFSKVIRFFGVMPKDVEKVAPMLLNLRPSAGDPRNTDPVSVMRVREIEGLVGRALEWTTYPDFPSFAVPTRATVVKLGDSMPSVLLLDDGRVCVATSTDCPPTGLHMWVMGWTANARSFERGPIEGEMCMVNHILHRWERVSYRVVSDAAELELVKGLIKTATAEASDLFDSLAASKGINPSIMN